MTLLDFVNTSLGILVLLSHIFIILAIIYFLFSRKKYPAILKSFSKNGIFLSFIIALIATAGSLFYSKIAGFNPCELCWYQRILMYPEVLLLGFALYKKESKIIDYSLLLTAVGWLISTYHNYTFYMNIRSTICKIGESCNIKYVVEFGYITIPIMALTAFTLIFILLLSQRNQREN
jgi:disulfide bond formation protein DsbB